jgi:hypothetical protein
MFKALPASWREALLDLLPPGTQLAEDPRHGDEKRVARSGSKRSTALTFPPERVTCATVSDWPPTFVALMAAARS